MYKEYKEKKEEYVKKRELAKEKLKALAVVNGSCVDSQIFGIDFIKQIYLDLIDSEIERYKVIKNDMPRIVGEPWELAESVGKKMFIDEQISYLEEQRDLILNDK